MLRHIDHTARRCVAWPLAAVGLALTLLASLLIQTSAWIVDVEVE